MSYAYLTAKSFQAKVFPFYSIILLTLNLKLSIIATALPLKNKYKNLKKSLNYLITFFINWEVLI